MLLTVLFFLNAFIWIGSLVWFAFGYHPLVHGEDCKC